MLRDHPSGAAAEVDFGVVWVMLNAESTRCFLFTRRLTYVVAPCHGLHVAAVQPLTPTRPEVNAR